MEMINPNGKHKGFEKNKNLNIFNLFRTSPNAMSWQGILRSSRSLVLKIKIEMRNPNGKHKDFEKKQ